MCSYVWGLVLSVGNTAPSKGRNDGVFSSFGSSKVHLRFFMGDERHHRPTQHSSRPGISSLIPRATSFGVQPHLVLVDCDG